MQAEETLRQIQTMINNYFNQVPVIPAPNSGPLLSGALEGNSIRLNIEPKNSHHYRFTFSPPEEL